MKKIISLFLAMCIIAGGTSVFASTSPVIVYDNFDYEIGSTLNSNDSANQPDEAKGFLTGWFGDVNLSVGVADNYVVAEGGILESVSSKSTAIYRQLSQPIDFSTDGLYVVSFNIQYNAEGSTTDNTRAQKLLFTTKGISTGTAQIQFGLGGGFGNTGIAPYIRLTSDLVRDTSIANIERGELYKAIVVIETSKDGNDKVKYKIFSDGDDQPAEYNIEKEKSLSSTYDVVGYQEYVGGKKENAFGNLVIESYSAEQISSIDEINGYLEQAEEEMSVEKINTAKALINELPDGEMKGILNLSAKAAEELLEAENLRLSAITDKLQELSQRSISANEIDTVLAELYDIENEINSIVNTAKKEELAKVYADEEKIIQEKIVSAARTAENFQYADMTDISQIGADNSNGWSGGYFFDEALMNPASGITAANGMLDFDADATLYREMTYPILIDSKFDTYLKVKFLLEEGGYTAIKIGDTEINLGSLPSLTCAGETVSATENIEFNKEYSAVVKITQEGACLQIYADNGNYISDVIEIEKSNLSGSNILNISGNNVQIYGISKEVIGKEFSKVWETALLKMQETLLPEDIQYARECADALPDCIVKEAINDTVGIVEAKRDEIIPKVRSVGMKGTFKVGYTITADYTIDDTVNNLKEVHLAWYCGGNKVGTGKSFNIPGTCGGKNIYCEIYAENTAGLMSDAVKSESMSIAKETSVTSGGGGGGGISAPKPIVFPEETTENKDETAKQTKFSDISGHWCEAVITDMVNNGIVYGKTEYEFEPDSLITRAEFIAILVRALGLKATGTCNFSDVSSLDWFYESVIAGSEAGLISGIDGAFCPMQFITREAMAKIAADASGDVSEFDASEISFTDEAEISDWSLASIKRAYHLGIISGMGGGRIAPKNKATRAEAVMIIKNLMDFINK